MVLDTVLNSNSREAKLIFKNTYDDEESGKFRKITMNASSPQAPDVFYYLHIDVDLTRIVFDLRNQTSFKHFPDLPYKNNKSPLEARNSE